MNSTTKKILLGIEFLLLFFCVPLLIYFDDKLVHPSAILLPIVLLLGIYLWRNPEFAFRDLVRIKLTRSDIIRSIVVFVITGIVLSLSVYVFDRENLFNLFRSNILIWILLCIFYPVFSAYMQEIIFRTFLFLRYKALFQSRRTMILASGIAFSFVHIVYYSALSMIITFFGGIFLAYVYDKTRSVLFTAILHGIFGDLIFTVGLGHYFWLDIDKFL